MAAVSILPVSSLPCSSHIRLQERSRLSVSNLLETSSIGILLAHRCFVEIPANSVFEDGLSIGSIGGKSNNTVDTVTFSNSQVVNSENGCRIKTNSGTTGTVRCPSRPLNSWFLQG